MTDSMGELFDELLGDDPEIAEIAAEIDPPHFLAINVYKLRTAREMTQAALAEAIGVAQPRIAQIECGDANPRLTTLGRIAFALGVPVADLLQVPPGYPARSLRHVSKGAAEASKPPRRKAG